jgi:hypothetical protein
VRDPGFRLPVKDKRDYTDYTMLQKIKTEHDSTTTASKEMEVQNFAEA